MKFLLKSKGFLNLFILVIIFFTSVLVRWDNLKDPMGRHHEWLTGHVLSAVYIMEQDGAAAHYFSPPWTFNTKADRYIVSFQPFKDKNNCTYYVSYPPLCFLLPYAAFKITGTTASILGIRILGLIVQFFTGFFIFLLIQRFFDRSIRKDFFIPSFIGFFLYTFAAGNLWFHGHVFFADMLVPLFISSFLYVTFKTLHGEYSILKSSLLLFATCFLGAYTEWQMLFVAFFTCVIFFAKGFKVRKNFIFFLIICVATLTPVALTYYQYTKIAGAEELYKVVSSKYKQRSGADQTAEGGMSMANSFSYENISQHYERNYADLLDVAWCSLLILIVVIIINKASGNKTFNSKVWLILGILFLSILLHHYAFFNFTAVHDFSTVKTSLFLSLFAAIVIGLVYNLISSDSKKTFIIASSALGIWMVWFFHFSTNSYYRVNQHSSIYKTHRALAEVVQKHVKEDEILFTNAYTTPETMWYCKRNIMSVNVFPDALEGLKRINSKLNGAYITFNDAEYQVIKYNTKGDTLSVFKDVCGHLKALQ